MTGDIVNVRHIYLDIQITEGDDSIGVTRVAQLVGKPQSLQNFTRLPIEVESAEHYGDGCRMWKVYDDKIPYGCYRISVVEDVE